MPHVHVRGVDLHYEEQGAGPHLIVAHGTLGSIASAPAFGLRTADIAARGLHVVSYDARGHGRSGHTRRRDDYHWSALAGDMLGLMDALRVDRASICGSSMGAGTALMLALAYPERVDRLILRSPPPFDVDIEGARRRMRGLMLLYRLLGAALTARIVTMFGDRSGREAQRALFAGQRRAAIVAAIQGLLFDGEDLPIEPLAEIRGPTIVLTHSDDVLHPLRSGDILLERLPHAKLFVAPSLRYWSDHPDTLTEIIAGFARDGVVAPERDAPGEGQGVAGRPSH